MNDVAIRNTFAEAFPMTATRLIITACNRKWVNHAINSITGFATSVIACKLEAGLEQNLDEQQTPDGRPGAAVLFFAMSASQLEQQVRDRIGQCVLTSPSSAAFAGIDQGKPVPMGRVLRYFGDGFQISKQIGKKRYWRIPVMDGEFICEDVTYRVNAIGGGNFLIIAREYDSALQAAERAVEAIAPLSDVITPFPGGIVRSGSKVGSKYKALIASTNECYCPTLRGFVNSGLSENSNAVLEIVIDGLSVEAINEAMRVGIAAACGDSADSGLVEITASNFGGKLGKFHFHLHELVI